MFLFVQELKKRHHLPVTFEALSYSSLPFRMSAKSGCYDAV